MLLIKNGRVIDPVTHTDEVMDVLIDGNHIVKTGYDLEAEGAEVIDADGLVVAPGLVDTHVHFRDPGFTYKEDIETGAAAAARGGFTMVVCMANTKPAVDNLETLKYIQDKGAKTGIHVVQTATVTKGLAGKELVDMDSLAAAGAAGFTDDGIPIMDEKLLLEAMEKARDLDLPVSLHEEDPLFIVQPGVNQGKVSEKLGYGGASRTAEDIMVARDCVLALHTGASVCIQHISSGNSVDIVRTAKKLGADVHAEATPHHFTLIEDAVLKYGTMACMNPPLRTEKDRRQIIEGIQDGTIDMIVTDHAPHSSEEKARPLDKAPSGITGLETSLALGIYSKGKRCLKPCYSTWRLVKRSRLLLTAVRGVIRHYHIYCAILYSLYDLSSVFLGSEWRIHTRHGSVLQHSILYKGEMMWSCLRMYVRSKLLCSSHYIHGIA